VFYKRMKRGRLCGGCFFILFACVIITLGKGKRMPIIYCGNRKKGQSGNSVLFIVLVAFNEVKK